MPHRYAPQNAGQQPLTDDIGVPKMMDGAESRSQNLRLISTGMGTQKPCTDTNPRDGKDITDFFSPTPNKQFSRISRKSEDVNHAILSRHQRSQSAGSANTCYVMHDSEGKPVMRLIANGFAVNKKLGDATLLREPSQTSGSSSRNVYKDALPLPNNEEIVLKCYDSSKDGRSLANNMQLEQDGVNGNGEQFHSDRKKQASGRRRRKKGAPKHVYSTENQESEEHLGSFRRHNSRRRRDSKDSRDYFEYNQNRRRGATTSATDINDLESQRRLHRQQNHKHGPRSQRYATKEEEVAAFRRSKNRNARFESGKDSSAKDSLEDTTQEPHSSASNQDFNESETKEDTASTFEDEEAKDTTASASENAATPKKGGGGGTPKKAETPKGKGPKGSASISEASKKKSGAAPSTSKTEASKKKSGAAPSSSKTALTKKSVATAISKKSVTSVGGKDKKKSVKPEDASKKKGGPTPSSSKTEAGKDKRKSEGGKDKKKSKGDARPSKSTESVKGKKKSKADAGKRKSSADKKKKKSKSLRGGRSSSIFTSSNESSRQGSRSASRNASKADISSDQGSRPASRSASKAEISSGESVKGKKKSKADAGKRKSSKRTSEAPSQPTSGQDTDASAILGLQVQQEPPAGDAGKGKKKAKKSKGSKGDLSEAASEANSSDNQSDATRKSAASSRSASPKPGKDKKRKDSKAGKDKKDKGKDKPRKDSKPGSAGKKKGPETTPGDEAGLVQGLAQAFPEQTPALAARESIMTNTSPPMYSGEPSRAPSAEEPYSWPPPEKEQPTEAESENFGTIVYQHVARYICIGMLRVAGGVRVLFDVAEKQGYVQVISPLCEPYVTYYVNNMTFLTSTSAAGVAWAGAIYRKKDSKSGKETGSEKKGESDEKTKKDKNQFAEEAIKSRLERCNLPEMSKTMIDTAHVVFCDPYQAQRFRTVLETLKSAVECSNCLIMPCIAGNSNLTFPGPPVVPCTIVDPACMQRPCPPPLPPPCCTIPFCAPNPNMQFQQQFCQCIPIGPNPCVGAPSRQQTDLCGGQQQGLFHLPCPDAFMNQQQYPCQGQPTRNPPDYNVASASPLLAQTRELWSGHQTPQVSSYQTPQASSYQTPQASSYQTPQASSYQTPQASSYQTPQASSYQTAQASSYQTPQTSAHPTPYPSQTQYQQHQMLNQNEMGSQPQPTSPSTYAQYSDLGGGGGGGVRFNPNVQYKQISQQETMSSNWCANSIPPAQMDCYDPYSYENCYGKTMFCAPACLVRLNSDMAWTDLQKGCLKIYQCPNNGGYSLVLENGEKAITTHHYLTPETIFTPSKKTQFGFTYTTVTRSENRGTLVDHYLVSFMSCRLAELFKCLVDRIRAALQSESEDWCGAPCPSKPQRPTPVIRSWQGHPS